MRGFVSGNFHEHFVAINYMKMYYGEKIAFEFAFLIHYQAWLLIPTVTGVMLTIYQIYVWNQFGIAVAMDNSLNGLFGIFVAIGSSLFIESWREK